MNRARHAFAVVLLAAAGQVGFGLIFGSFGCASAVKTFDELNNPKDDAALAHCRQVARDTKKATGGDGGAGLAAYDECTKDAGF